MTSSTCTTHTHSTEWLSFRQIAEELDIALRTLYNRRHRGEGPRAYVIGGRLRVRRSDLDTWLEAMADQLGDTIPSASRCPATSTPSSSDSCVLARVSLPGEATISATR